MSDTDIVRATLAEAYLDDDPRAQEALAALARMEEENELFTQREAKLTAKFKEKYDEVEQLREVRDKMFEKNALQRKRNKRTEDEVERLTAENEDQFRKLEDAAAEVERLTNLLEQYGLSTHEDLVNEVERLRAELQGKVDATFLTLNAEVERLRASRKEWMDKASALQFEVERLRSALVRIAGWAPNGHIEFVIDEARQALEGSTSEASKEARWQKLKGALDSAGNPDL